MDPKPQVRQYAAKALGAYGSNAQCELADLRDMAINPVEKEYNQRTAQSSIKLIEEAQRIKEILDAHRIRYRYDERFRILDAYAIRPNFYLPEFDVYIEYCGA